MTCHGVASHSFIQQRCAVHARKCREHTMTCGLHTPTAKVCRARSHYDVWPSHLVWPSVSCTITSVAFTLLQLKCVVHVLGVGSTL